MIRWDHTKLVQTAWRSWGSVQNRCQKVFKHHSKIPLLTYHTPLLHTPFGKYQTLNIEKHIAIQIMGISGRPPMPPMPLPPFPGNKALLTVYQPAWFDPLTIHTCYKQIPLQGGTNPPVMVTRSRLITYQPLKLYWLVLNPQFVAALLFIW